MVDIGKVFTPLWGIAEITECTHYICTVHKINENTTNEIHFASESQVMSTDQTSPFNFNLACYIQVHAFSYSSKGMIQGWSPAPFPHL